MWNKYNSDHVTCRVQFIYLFNIMYVITRFGTIFTDNNSANHGTIQCDATANRISMSPNARCFYRGFYLCDLEQCYCERIDDSGS